MKKDNGQPFKISVSSMNGIAFIVMIVNVISERLGTYPNYSGGRFSQMEMVGILIPLMILVIPIFAEQYRHECWNKYTLIISFSVLIISVFLIMVMYANKEYYSIPWIENGEWTWDNSPPIHWDFWNIL